MSKKVTKLIRKVELIRDDVSFRGIWIQEGSSFLTLRNIPAKEYIIRELKAIRREKKRMTQEIASLKQQINEMARDTSSLTPAMDSAMRALERHRDMQIRQMATASRLVPYRPVPYVGVTTDG